MDRFKGTYMHTLDQKNRMFIPAQFRKKLIGEEEKEFVVMKSPKPEKCLFIYPADEWEQIEMKLDEMEPGKDSRKKYRLVYSRIDVLNLDKQGRIALKDDFCLHALIEKDVMILGSGKRIELWSPDEWNRMTDSSDEDDFDWNEIPW